MGKMKTMMTSFSVAGAVLVIYFSLRVFGALSQGYSWSEMDWDQDGVTSIGEFFAASDVGKREVNRDGKKLIEYFSYKDGLPVKIVSPPSAAVSE